MPIAIGTAITSANNELNTVTWKSSAMPNRRLAGSLVLNSELVMKFALFAASEGTARTIRKNAIKAIAAMIVAPAATATDPKIRSPLLPPWLSGMSLTGVIPAVCLSGEKTTFVARSGRRAAGS